MTTAPLVGHFNRAGACDVEIFVRDESSAAGGIRRDADFQVVTFCGDADFKQVTFIAWADFEQVTFNGGAGFEQVTFNGEVNFNHATFKTPVPDVVKPFYAANTVGLEGL